MNTKKCCLILGFVVVALVTSFVSNAELWAIISESDLVDFENIKLNRYGNRETTVRHNSKGFMLNILTEYDCNSRRSRVLSTSLLDQNGKLINSTSEPSKRWYDEKDSVGLGVVCRASI